MTLDMSSTILPERDDAFRSTRVPELSRHSYVNDLLKKIGLGVLCENGLRSVLGRNLNWIGWTESGTEVFVKKVLGSTEEVVSRIRRTVAHDEILSGSHDRGLAGPRCLGWNEENGVVVFDFLGGTRTGTSLVEEGKFPPEISERIGRMVAHLHETDVSASVMDTSPMPLPSAERLEGLAEEEYLNAPHATRRMWNLLQNDGLLRQAILDLLDSENCANRVPSHCDLRVDQVLVVDGHPHLTDWEEFRLADPARDMGSYTGEWLYRAALDLEAGSPGAEDSLDSVAESGATALARLKPQITAFWEGYRSVRSHTGPDFEARATAFAGWHLMERVLSGTMRSSRLAAGQLAAAGVGRKALLRPEAFTSTLGIEG